MKRTVLACLWLLAGLAAASYAASYTLTVLFSGTNQPKLQSDLITAVTTQFQATVSPSPFGSNAFIVNVSSEGMLNVVVSSPIATASAFDQCIAYGFANGLDYERSSDLRIIRTDESVDVSSAACAMSYGMVQNDLAARWGMVFSSTGAIIVP